MTDKVQKIKDWISKEQEGLMDAQGNFEFPGHEGAYHILCNLDAYIDSLQEEPVSEDFEMALAEMVAKAQTCVVEPWVVAAQWKDELIKLAKSEEPVSKDLEEAAKNHAIERYRTTRSKALADKCKWSFITGAKWQKDKTLSDVKKAVAGKAFQFSMDNVEAWGDDSNGNGKPIKLKGRVTFQVSNPESIIDALFAEI